MSVYICIASLNSLVTLLSLFSLPLNSLPFNRSSVTRMSVDQKASVTSKIAEQEGIAGGAGDASTITLPSPVEEEAAGVRPWVKRRQQLAAAVEAEVPPKVERKEQEEEPTPTPAKPAEPPAAAPAAAPPTPSTAAAAAAALSSASSTATAAAAAAASRARAEMAKVRDPVSATLKKT